MGKATNVAIGVASLALSAAVPGAAFAWGRFGASLGLMALGQLINSSGKVEGARLNNLAVTLDTEGADLPRGWGTWRQGLRLVWSSGLIEHKKKKKAGKGGPTQTDYRYSTKLLYVGGRGPITRLNRIKLNQYVIYDWNGGDELGATLTWADGHWSGKTKDGITFRIYPGTLSQPVDTLPEIDKGVDQWTNYPREWLLAVEIEDLEKFGRSIPQVTVEPYYNVVALASVIEEIGSWVDLAPSNFDLLQLAGLTVAPTVGEGFLVESRKAAADAIAELMMLFHFSLPEVDGVLRAVLRPSGFVADIEEKALKVRAGYSRDVEVAPSPLREADENTLPQIKEITFRDVNRENTTGYRSARKEGTGSRRKSSVSTGASLKGDRAAGIARVLLAEEHAASKGRDGTLGFEYLRLSAADELRLATSDGKKPFILDEQTTPFFGPIESKFIGFDPLVYNLALPPDTGGLPRNTPAEHGLPITFAAECVAPPADSKFWRWPSLITGVCPYPGDEFTGAVINLDRKKGDETEWKEIFQTIQTGISTIGELTAPFTPSAPEEGYVAAAQINCKVWSYTLSSCPLEVAQTGANVILFETGVLASFTTANLSASVNSVNFYVLSQIQCGLYGSDDLLSGAIPTGTRFILLTDSEGQYDSGPMWLDFKKALDTLDALIRLRVNNVNGDEQLTLNLGTFAGRNVEPPSPVVAQALRQSNGDLRLVGRARSRDASWNTEVEGSRRVLDEPTTGGAFKFLITLESDGDSKRLDLLTMDGLGAFDWTITASELDSLFGSAPGELSGTVALYGRFGAGRPAAWNQTEES